MEQHRRPIRSRHASRSHRLVLAASLAAMLGLAACDTGPGGSVDPDVVDGETDDGSGGDGSGGDGSGGDGSGGDGSGGDGSVGDGAGDDGYGG